MNINSIQSVNSQTDVLSLSRPRTSVKEIAGRNLGPDTVSISAEARQLARQLDGETAEASGKTGQVSGEEAKQNIADQLQTGETQQNQSTSTFFGTSVFGKLLESLFLAELKKNSDTSTLTSSAEDVAGTQPQANAFANPFTDNAKAAELKKLINDVVTGKADISYY